MGKTAERLRALDPYTRSDTPDPASRRHCQDAAALLDECEQGFRVVKDLTNSQAMLPREVQVSIHLLSSAVLAKLRGEQ